ncbi:unnamed protein product [Arabis nemorensis]|uniref:TOD1/MUCI70 glycosyltransferase-like domain-containing protein n=1 Tax=Arabis nemorensis TaxID=586526 RepID=A0A565BK97_9BRAS|nr:unnamed protein product [Arabis nemorensis]
MSSLFWLQSVEDGQKIQVPPTLNFSGNTNKEQIKNLSYVGKAVKPYRPRPPPYFVVIHFLQNILVTLSLYLLHQLTKNEPDHVVRSNTNIHVTTCPVCYLPLEEAIALMPSAPSFSPVLKNLTYIHEKPLNRKTEFGGSDFGGHPTLKQRRRSFNIKATMSVHCGFVKGTEPGRGTGFDIDKTDLLEMKRCRRIVVASEVFDAFDDVKSPRNISKYSEQTVCFFMFVDEKTEARLKRDKDFNVTTMKVGLWRVVVVHNLPY